MDKKTMSLNLPFDIYKKLEKLAKENGMSKTAYIRFLIIQAYRKECE